MIKEAMRLRANCEREELLGPFWCVNLGSIRWKVALIVEAGESFPPVPNGTRENQLLLDCGEENTHRETGWLQFFGTQRKHLELTMYTPVCTITSEGIPDVSSGRPSQQTAGATRLRRTATNWVPILECSVAIHTWFTGQLGWSYK